jgi:hypothetical protein
MRRPEVGFAARETSLGIYKFQAVMYVAARNGQDMTKTLEPHAKLLSEQETKQHGFDTKQLVERTKQRRVSNRPNIISWQDLW